MTSVLNKPIMLSASALSYESPTLPTEGSIPATFEAGGMNGAAKAYSSSEQSLA